MRSLYCPFAPRLCAILAVGALAVGGPVQAFSLFDGATEWTQLANNAELVDILKTAGQQVDHQLTQITQLAEQIDNQLKIYQNLVQNTTGLPGFMWSDAQKDLTALKDIVAQGQSISFAMANADTILKQRFASYTELRAATPAGGDLASAYSTWSATNRDTIAGTLRAAGLASDQFGGETETLQSLEAMSENADGQLKALQVGHQIAAEQVVQMQKLRGLLAQQMTMMATWLQSAQTEKDLGQARLEKFFNAQATEIPDGQKMEPRW